MSVRHVGRLLSTLTLVWLSAVIAAACGSSAGTAPTTGSDASIIIDTDGPRFSFDATKASPCSPLTCAERGFTCGQNGDGCGGTIDCGTCPANQECGAASYSKCGNPALFDSGTVNSMCTPTTCAAKGYDCGSMADGCGNLLNCGPTTCPGGGFCGGGGFDKCGTGTNPLDGGPLGDGGIACVPATCASLGFTCGQAADGCGGTTPSCGTCAAPLMCGAGGKPNSCGNGAACGTLCQKQVACDAGATTTLSGIVRAGKQEGSMPWVPAGTTPDPVPGVLVYIPTTPIEPFDGNPNSPHVICSQCGADVSGNPLVTATTDYSGKFTLKNVPVSASTGDTIPIVIQLGRWRRQFAFPIMNPCAPNTLPQDLNLPSKSSEGDIPLTAISTGNLDPIECVLLKMGVSDSEFTSYSTWNGETASGTTPKPGRIHIYTETNFSQTAASNGVVPEPGSSISGAGTETDLLGSGSTGAPTNGTFMMYDQILLPCWGGPAQKNGAELSNLGYYGDHGGHFFTTHYSYSWLDGNNSSALTTVAQWDPEQDENASGMNNNGQPFTGNVHSTVPVTNPGLFVKWLNYVGALSNSNPAGGGGATPPMAPTVTLTAARHDVDRILNQSVDWIDGTDPNPTNASKTQMLLHFTFDMPIPTAEAGAPTQCGHGIYSDFHVVSTGRSYNSTFPKECDNTAMTSQERILEYMIWDLASCVPPPPTSNCTPKICSQYPAGTCGQQSDGCSGLTANCGTCPAGQVCGGGGAFSVCVTPPVCVPQSCAAQNIQCGPSGDGCGGLNANCGTCTPPQTCGGGGVPGQCGGHSTCVPETCKELNVNCGPAGDGCGNLIASCGVCSPPQTCGGGGTPGQCGAPIQK